MASRFGRRSSPSTTTTVFSSTGRAGSTRTWSVPSSSSDVGAATASPAADDVAADVAVAVSEASSDEQADIPSAKTTAPTAVHDDQTVDVFTSGRKMRLTCSPNVDAETLKLGQTVRLNEALTIVEAGNFERVGEISTLREVLDDGQRALVVGHADEERIVWLAEPLATVFEESERESIAYDAESPTRKLRPGDSLLVDTKAGYAFERIPKAEVEDLVLEEVPDVHYDDIGGLGRQIEQIRDAVELPFLHKDLFHEYELRPPKGVLLYGPPGCGKTLIAKAVANSLAKKIAEARGQDSKEAKSYFLNIKGPELLNKFVGETERHIRLIFQRARE
ncbi:MAG: AAA family ATPase, partial [Rhodococcus sp. (in: high G+C Gram-positive bacteria)]